MVQGRETYVMIQLASFPRNQRNADRAQNFDTIFSSSFSCVTSSSTMTSQGEGFAFTSACLQHRPYYKDMFSALKSSYASICAPFRLAGGVEAVLTCAHSCPVALVPSALELLSTVVAFPDAPELDPEDVARLMLRAHEAK